MDTSCRVHFVALPGVLRAPLPPARFRRLPRGDAMKGISKFGEGEDDTEVVETDLIL